MKIVIPIICGKKLYGNCDTKLGLGTSDTLTARYFNDLIGVSTVESESIRKLNCIEGDIEEYRSKNYIYIKTKFIKRR